MEKESGLTFSRREFFRTAELVARETKIPISVFRREKSDKKDPYLLDKRLLCNLTKLRLLGMHFLYTHPKLGKGRAYRAIDRAILYHLGAKLDRISTAEFTGGRCSPSSDGESSGFTDPEGYLLPPRYC